MKRFIALLAVLALAGCATTAPSQSYTVAGQKLRIGGEYDELSTIVKITINGKTVIEDSMGIFGKYKEFLGDHDSKSVLARCDFSFFGSLGCEILINDEKAADLDF